MADNYNSLYTGPEIDASVGKVLTTQDAWDGAVAAQLPAGGDEGQILIKTGAADYATGWKTPVFVRPNLLDNWYWVYGKTIDNNNPYSSFGTFPINQRGRVEYDPVTNLSSTSLGSIDRWVNNGSNYLKATINDDSVTLANPSGYNRLFIQMAPQGRWPAGEYTASILVSESTGSISFGPRYLSTGGKSYTMSITGMTGLIEHTVTVEDPAEGGTDERPDRFVIILGVRASITVKAVKLEIGDTQTLAHQEDGEWVLNEIPNYAEELLKCQRYLQAFSAQALRPTYGIDFRPVMATAQPTPINNWTIGSTDYYLASSEPTP